MVRSRFLWRLYAGYVAVLVVAAVPVGIFVGRDVEHDTTDDLDRALRAQAVFLAEIVASTPTSTATTASLQDRVRALASKTHTRLTVVASDGRVIADSERDPATLDNHANRPEILAAAKVGLGRATRFSNSIETTMMYLAVPIGAGAQRVGYARTALPLTAVSERQGRVWQTFALAGGVVLALVLLLGFVVAHGIAGPLSAMTHVAEAMAQGDYAQRLQVLGNNEVGQLAHAFNRMAASCRERMETIVADRNKLHAILAGMVEGVIAIDPDERIVHVNSAGARLLGTPTIPATGRCIWEVSRAPQICEALARALHQGSAVSGQIRIVAQPDDQVVDMHAVPLFDGDQQLVGALAVLHDITELDRLETVRSDFVANVSHELKTPITAIRGLIETLVDTPQIANDARQAFLLRVKAQTLRLSDLVTDLLALSRLESGSIALSVERLDIRDVIRAVATDLAPLADQRAISVKLELPESSVELEADEEALRQAVTNLLDNALKYTPQGGHVRMQIEADSAYAVVTVQDTGVGFEIRHKHRLFERFYRIDKARSRDLGGTGLGLAIVKHVVLAHGGSIAVDSAPGKGSTFSFRLPLRQLA